MAAIPTRVGRTHGLSRQRHHMADHPHACGENTRFIIQVAALSWAATQVPEITAAIQSFLNVGFRSAAQVEFVVMIGGLHPVTKTARSRSFQEILFLNALSAIMVGATR